MLSFYDALDFSLRKKTLFIGVLTGFIMLFFLTLIGISLQTNFGFFSAFQTWLLNDNTSAEAIMGLAKMAAMLKEPLFWSVIFKKLLWASFLLVFIGISFFALEVVIAKKALFNQPPHFTVGFFIITLGKLMILLTPILSLVYYFFYKVLKSVLAYHYSSFILGKNLTYQIPFKNTQVIIFGCLAFIYFVYVFTLFIERFSFQSLLNPKPLLKKFSTILELSLHIFVDVFCWLLGIAVIIALYWFSNSLYACFLAIISYLLWMSILNSARLVFMLPLCLIGLSLIAMQLFFGKAFFENYLFSYLLGMLAYFYFFLFWAIFWGVLAYLFASTAYVLRFEKTPAKDVRKQSPDKLRRLDALYADYLKEHKNDKQKNYFHHLEGKKK